MDGFALDLVPADAVAPALGDLVASLAPAPLIATALVILLAAAGLDAARALRDRDR